MKVQPRPAAAAARRRVLIITGIVVGVTLILLAAASTFYTEVLWFNEVGFSPVFWKGIWVRLGMGAVFGLAFAAVILVNLWIVRKITNPSRLFAVGDEVLERYRQTLQPYMKWLVIGGSLLFGLFAGSGASSQWRQWLLFSNSVDFGTTDAVFGRDIGFYVFRLPFHQFLFAWAFSLLVVATLVSAAAHYFMGGIRPQSNERVAPEVRAHLSVLLGLIVLLKAWGYRLDQFNLLYSERGTVVGASYTDVNAQLPALKLLVVIALITSAFFFINARFKNWILPIAGIGLLALISIGAGGIYPAAVQRLQVAPNERLREQAFIQRNLDATKQAFAIDEVEVVSFPARRTIDPAAIERNRTTIENIRLWDPNVLREQYVTLQRIKQYYEFLDVDIDRYDFNGERRQVMLSAREVDSRGLDASAQTWLNTHLVYTHGYGVVASRVDRVTPEGQPSFVIREIPPTSTQGAPELTEAPQIYYGEMRFPEFVVAKTEQEELDFPVGDEFEGTHYDGDGGVEIGGMLRRAAYAWRFRDVNLLISGAIRSDSRVMYHRNIRDRVERVAPFLRFEPDPYIGIVDGRLVWLIDAYTTTDMYPYSERTDFGVASEGMLQGGGNYIRNAAKFVVDAKDGTITGYIWDEQDPILQAWTTIFPDVLRPRSEMSEGLLERVRYPEGMFRVQSHIYAPYHIPDANNFYSKEDVWNVGRDPTVGGLQAPPAVPPYYVLQQLPGEDDLAFVLVRPFTPVGRQNLTAYLVAHGDHEQYGRMVAYRFPTREAIFGTQQIQGEINADPEVARQISLWNQQNSRVIYGNLLIVPLEDSLMYVQPLYLLGEGSSLPLLQRVIAVVGNQIRMGDTLDDAIERIMEGRPSEIDVEVPGVGETVAQLLERALQADRLAQEALRRGDFGEYGRQQARMREALEAAGRASGAEPPPPEEDEQS